MSVLDGLTFDDVSIPDTIGPHLTDTGSRDSSTDPACEVCGEPLVYGGRGRRPKRCDIHKRSAASTTPRTPGIRTSNDVNSALAVLDTIYNTVGMGVFMVSPVTGYAKWAEDVRRAQEQNRVILTGDREMTRKINALAAKGGHSAFLITQVTLVAPTLMLCVGEVRARSAARAQERDAREAAQAAAPMAPDPGDPTARFAP